MVNWGRTPSCTAWRLTLNAPEMTACEAMTVATVASRTMGIRAQPGRMRKNGFSTAVERCRMSAPWPR